MVCSDLVFLDIGVFYVVCSDLFVFLDIGVFCVVCSDLVFLDIGVFCVVCSDLVFLDMESFVWCVVILSFWTWSLLCGV